ncbi:type IV secretory system conjugative DNA transfer family protein [Microbacterium sp. CFBP 8794]|uniref:type IV secretory system conjugative DNA transfer family protein n=1 Tax=Microbacterium sp. CFBP 8794 TaxID=2775269 RepID=UPI00178252E2|nr:type IV secretory system conjugative DNA transfer family protein [Microbacterium sp. CFBP 8794]MBD8478933.1 type IV secretory system conjugative DNA transfer family protein [Microbacterium sp. CFBP 8794]
MTDTWRQLHWPRPFDAATALGFLETLAADEARGPVVLEARAEHGSIRHLMGGHRTTLSAVSSSLRRLLPGVAVTDLESNRVPVERAGRVRIRQRNLGLSLDTTGAGLRGLYAALSGAVGKGDVLVLQVVLGASVPPQPLPASTPDPNLSLFDLITKGSRPAPLEIRADLRDKLAQYRFRATIRIGVGAASPVRRRLLVHAVLAALRQLQTGSTRIDLVSDRPELVDEAVIPTRKPLRLTAAEALCLVGWPTGDTPLPGMPPIYPRRIARPIGFAPSKDRVFATTNAPGKALPVGISIKDAVRHTHAMGPNGVGKSTVLLNLIAADIAAGRSVVVIDAKRDLAMDVLTVIPESRSGDVVVLDPISPDPVGLNPFAGAGEDGPLVADRLLAVFRGLFPSAFGPRTSDAVHASLLTLAGREGTTLADLPRLLTDDPYRRSFTKTITDPSLVEFWAQYDATSAGARAAMIGPVLTRLRQFLLRPSIRAVLDQPAPRFDLRDLFTKPRVLVVPLNRGLLGPVAAELVGSLLVSQLWQLTLARAEVPKEQRRPVSIYLDEAQMFVKHESDLGEALEQSRSMNVAWHLAHQHRAQMPTSLLAGIAANARNKIQFQADPVDAAAVTRYSALTPEDVMKLPPYHVYVDLMAGGVQSGWFSAVTLPPPVTLSDPDAVLAESRLRYGSQVTSQNPPATDATVPTPEQGDVGVTLKGDGAGDEGDAEPIGRRRKARP